MTLSTHAIAGAAVGALAAGNPALAASGAFMSHFLLDAIPHWDYKLSSSERKEDDPMTWGVDTRAKGFALDLAKTGFDSILGIGVVAATLALLGAPAFVWLGAILGALFGILPDFLQFVYFKVRREPLSSLQRFHIFMHADGDFNDRPAVGIPMQLGVWALSIAAIAVLVPLLI